MEKMVKESERNVSQIYQLKGNGVLVHTFNSSTWEAKANKTLWFQGSLGLHGETLISKIKKKKGSQDFKRLLKK